MSDQVGHPKVKGCCPMGCGDTLFLGTGGYVTCSLIGCPDPSAASEILEDPETEHIVVFDEKGFTVQHPLRERLAGELFDCPLHEYCRRFDGPPVVAGRYRAHAVADGQWRFEATPTPEVAA